MAMHWAFTLRLGQGMIMSAPGTGPTKAYDVDAPLLFHFWWRLYCARALSGLLQTATILFTFDLQGVYFFPDDSWGKGQLPKRAVRPNFFSCDHPLTHGRKNSARDAFCRLRDRSAVRRLPSAVFVLGAGQHFF